ncbi:MAG: hypothetical protein CVT74_16430, partial [Alphaproteobacteria bacterium HGW-Alphaproteobacteria-13]
MPTPFFADLVREMCHDGGTGPLTPTGAAPGHRRFADAVPPGASFHYAVASVAWPAEWENGTGHIDADGRLVRETVAASSHGGARVDFAPGLKTIALTVGAAWFAGQQDGAAAQGAALAGLADALAGKQPLSTGHAAAANGVDGDTLTVRRSAGWVNIPLAALAYRDAGGRVLAGAPLACADGTAALPSIGFAADPDTGVYRPGANVLSLVTGGVERVRVDAGGRVGIGTASSTHSLEVIGSDGVLLGSGKTSGAIKSARLYSPAYDTAVDAQVTVYYAYNADTANILMLGGGTSAGQAATTVRICTADAIGTHTGAVHWEVTGGHLLPGSNNLYNIGSAAQRVKTYYGVDGAINTSDAREKTALRAFTAAELRAGRRIAGTVGIFQFLAAIEAKGAQAAREHVGVIAQEVWAIMADEGLIDPLGDEADPSSRYAFLCWDQWDARQDAEEGDPVQAAGDRFGIRPDQLALFLIAAQEARLAALEAA